MDVRLAIDFVLVYNLTLGCSFLTSINYQTRVGHWKECLLFISTETKNDKESTITSPCRETCQPQTFLFYAFSQAMNKSLPSKFI